MGYILLFHLLLLRLNTTWVCYCFFFYCVAFVGFCFKVVKITQMNNSSKDIIYITVHCATLQIHLVGVAGWHRVEHTRTGMYRHPVILG